VKDLAPLAVDSNPKNLTAANGLLYFTADDGSTGYELYKSDGTPAGTGLVKDVTPGPLGNSPYGFVGYDSKVYFIGDDGVHGAQLFLTDGTSAGTVPVQNLSASTLASANGVLYVTAADALHGYELWKVDARAPLTFSGSSLYVRMNPANTQVQVFVNVPTSGAPTFTTTRGQISSIVFTGTGSNDTLTIDYSNGIPNGLGSTFVYNAGNGTDSLIILGTSGADIANVDNSGVNISNVITSASAAETITVDLAGSDDVMNYSATSFPGLIYRGNSGANTLNVTGGTYTFATDASVDNTLLTVNVNNASNVLMNVTQHLTALNINNGTVTLATGAGKVLVVKALFIDIAAGSKLNLNTNGAIVDYTGASPLQTIRGYLASGRGTNTWNAAGIMSTSASLDVTHFAVGYGENSEMPLFSYNTFLGQPVDQSAILIRYTLGADATLDGVVGDEDVTIVGALWMQTSAAQWYYGDFDYTGLVDAPDVAVLQLTYNQAAPPITFAPVQTQSSLSTSMVTTQMLATNSDIITPKKDAKKLLQAKAQAKGHLIKL
jgi:ELWxxDGT repeat protein